MISRVQLFVTPWTVACQASLSMGFPRQEYWSGLPFPPPGDVFSTQGSNPDLLHCKQSPALQVDSFRLSNEGKPITVCQSVSQSVSSVAQSCPTLCDPMNRSTPGLLSITNSQSPPKPMSIETVMPSNHLILCSPLLMPSVFPSIRVFSDESARHIRWPKYWSFSFNISPSNEHPGLISFRMD